MFMFKRMLPALCISLAATAQAPADLNGLVAAARGVASQGMHGQKDPGALDLQSILGEGENPVILLNTAQDVQHWTLSYAVKYLGPPQPQPLPQTASLDCIRGKFGNFLLSEPPLLGHQSLENTWFAIPLGTAISQLNLNGYQRGFSRVELKRLLQAGVPDEMVYVFTCPWERARVAISANTGSLVWYQMF